MSRSPSPESQLERAIEWSDISPEMTVGLIRAALGDIAKLRDDLAAAERSAALARGSLALARDELARVGARP